MLDDLDRRRIAALEHALFGYDGTLPDRTLLGAEGNTDEAYERWLRCYARDRLRWKLPVLLGLVLLLFLTTAVLA